MWNNLRALNHLANFLVGISLIACVATGVWVLANLPAFALHRISLEAEDGGPLRHVHPNQVRMALAPLRGSLFTVDLLEVRRLVRQIPWVRDVSVRRHFPNRLRISIDEQRAIATWRQGLLMNQFGEVFSANQAEADDRCDLAMLTGPSGTEVGVYERMRTLQEWLAPLNRRIERLELTPQFSWRVELQGPLTIEFGRDSLPTPFNERIQRFVESQQSLFPDHAAANLQRIDLRYASGYAYSMADTDSAVAPQELSKKRMSCVEYYGGADAQAQWALTNSLKSRKD